MALNDLTNPISLPNGLDTANNNPVAKAEKVVVTGTNQSVTESLNGKESSLGNPSINGQVLVSQTDGTRSWTTPNQGSTPTDLTTLESKVSALYPLTPNVNSLNDFASIYDPIHGAATVDIINGYSLIADYRASDDKYESTGVSYDGTGTDVIRYSNLTGNLHRSFGFKVSAIAQVDTITLTGTSGTANINIEGTDYLVTFATDLATTATNFVTTHGAALATAGVTATKGSGASIVFTANSAGTAFTSSITNVTGDLDGSIDDTTFNKTLMSIVDGSDLIPFIDITSSGRLRVNNFVPKQTVSQNISDQLHQLTRTGGTEIISATPGSVATFTVTNFPSDATNKSRRIEIDPDVRLNGTDTLASGFVTFDAPSENEAQAKRTISHRFQLGPLYGNRTVDVNFGYEFRVSGDDLLLDMTIESATLSSGSESLSFDFEPDTYAFLNYTSQTTVERQDRWNNASNGSTEILVTGDVEFILSARPDIPFDGSEPTFIDMVPVIVSNTGIVTQLGDVTVAIPTPIWGTVEIPDDIEFRTFVADHYFIHSELASILSNRAIKWCYGIARLQSINTGKSLTESINLAQGSTINGSLISTQKSELVVYESVGKGTGNGELVSSVTLPSNYGDYAYIHVTEYDVSSLQFRHAEIPTYIFTADLVDSNDNVRLQGNTVMSWDSSQRQLSMVGNVQEIFRVSLKD